MSWFIQQALAGNCFIGSTATAGVVPPAIAGNTHTFALWNPAGSGVNAILNNFSLAPASVTTTVIGAVGFGVTLNAGSQIGTGAPIVAFTQTAPVNALVGSGKASKVRFAAASGAVTTVANPAWLYGPGIFSPDGDMATSLSNVQINVSFNGCLIIPPSVAIFVVGTGAIAQTYNMALTWAEVALNL